MYKYYSSVPLYYKYLFSRRWMMPYMDKDKSEHMEGWIVARVDSGKDGQWQGWIVAWVDSGMGG